MLTSTVRSAIPTQIDPTAVPQALFAPGTSTFALSTLAGLRVVGVNFYHFSVDYPSGSGTTIFSSTGATNSTDVALAFFDADGNLLQIADADVGGDGTESLSATLTSQTPYVLGVYTANTLTTAPAAVTLTVNTGQQRINSPITIDPSAGTAEFLANSGEDTFTAPADVNYFPINLTNVGQSATVTLNPDGPDVQFFGELFEQSSPTSPWVAIDSGSGPTVTLTATPPAGGDDTDAQYLLAASPLNFNTAPQSYKVDLASGALLAPATVDPTGARDLGLAVPSAVGTAQATSGPGTALLLGAPKVFTVRASTTGPLKISGNGITFSPLVSVYDATGASLLSVASLTAQGVVSTTINATAGSSYVIRLADDHNNNNGVYLVTATQSYAPTPVSATMTLGQQTGLALDPTTGGAFFRITPPAGADYLALQLTPDAGSTLTPEIAAVGPNLSPNSRTAAAGQPATLAVDLSKNPGPVDIFVVGTSGTGTATLSYQAVQIPRQIPLGQFATQTINLKSGAFSLSMSSPGFGQITGAQFYEISPGASESLTAMGSGGATALLLRYIQKGGVLQLDDRSLPATNGTATLSATLSGPTLYAVAAIPLNLDGAGTIQLSLAGTAPPGIGVQMVPDPPPPQIPTMSKLRIRNVVLQSSYERDLWQTLLPFDMTATPVVTFSPVHAGQPLTATVTVLDSQDNVLAVGTSTPGGTLTMNLVLVTPASYAGQQLRFLVEPINGQPIGDGMYNLEMDVATADPTPFLLTETHFNPQSLFPKQGTLPIFLTIGSIPFNGTATGSFNSSSPYYGGEFGNTGSIAMYAFSLPNLTTPFEVYTQDLSSAVNTTIGLYYAHYTGGTIDGYDEVPGTSPNLDYFPANRSQIDAQIVVNNYHLLDNLFTGAYAPGANKLYVVVKNEQGTQGNFQIGARSIPTNLIGPGSPDSPLSFGGNIDSLVVNPESGSGTFNFPGSSDSIEFSTPSTFTGSTATLTVHASNANVDTVFADLYASAQFLISSTSVGGQSVFVLPLSSLTATAGYFLHVHFGSGQPINAVTLSLSVAGPNPQPSPTDALASLNGQRVIAQTEPYLRANPDPAGNFGAVAGFNTLYGSGTMLKDLFAVSSSGQGSFSIATGRISNETFALYRVVGVVNEFTSYSGVLVDYASSAAAGSTLTLSDYLFAGTYYVKLMGTAPNFGFGVLGGSYNLTASVPAYDAAQVTLDPNSAINDTAALRTPDDQGQASIFDTEFYQVTAPGAVQSALSVDLNVSNNPAYGQFEFAVWKAINNGIFTTYSQVATGSIDEDLPNPPTFEILTGNDAPAPGTQYFIGINRDRQGANLLVGPGFTIPQSGDPDLVVSSLQLTPDNGRTRVTATVLNQAFAVAPTSHAKLTFSNYSMPSIINLPAIGQYGQFVFTADWDPDSPFNSATFTANYDNQFAEINTNNNTQTASLSTVDAHAPTVSIALSDPTLNAETAANTWGRYVAGVTGAPVNIIMTSQDADSNLYEASVSGPFSSVFIAGDGASVPSHQNIINWDLGSFSPTSPTNPNVIHYSAIDAYGLKSGDHVQNVDVVPSPGFYTSMTWDPVNKVYDLGFQHDFVNLQGTINDLLSLVAPVTVPVVGDKNNQFQIGMSASGTASLDPTKAVSLPLGFDILVKALDTTLWNPTFNGTTQLTDNLSLHTSLAVNSHTLDVTAAAISLQLQNLKLLDLQTPTIKLFSFGLPGIASLDASLGFGLSAALNAGIKLGIDPNFLIDPLHAPLRVGVMSPTFIEPSIGGSATVEGSADVLGFDAAAFKGTVSLGLDVTVGLDNNDPSKVISFSDLLDNLAVKINATFGIRLEADVILVGDVWDYTYSHTFTFDTSKQGIITMEPAAALPADPAIPPPVIKSGNALVGAYPISPVPQLVIDPSSGDALSVQVVNVGQTPGVTEGNLQVSQRVGGVWSDPLVLPSADAENPDLALTHDNPGNTAGVVVYEGLSGADTATDLTLSQRLADTELRYRYFDGNTWGPEQSLTDDGLMNSSASVAFNASGQGVVSWVHNTNPSPMDANGNFSRDTQDIQAAVWDANTHSWSAPIDITTPDDVADSKPASFVDDAGNMYVVWIHDTANANELLFSKYDGNTWSVPAVVPITGLAPGGSFGEVALGRDQLGRVNVIFSYRTMAADGSVDSRLYDSFSTPDSFGQPAGVEQITQGANYYHLRTTNAPDGSLVAYWQQEDGANNGVFEATLSRNAANPSIPWTAPTRLTSTTDLTLMPSLAVDTGGQFQTLYQDQTPPGGTPAGPSNDPQVGVPEAPGVASTSFVDLPELSFSTGLHFPFDEAAAPVGSTATGAATILNHGLASSQVTITWFSGTPDTGTLLGTQQITLGAGHSYSFSAPFPVASGQQTYSVQVSSASGEAITTDDDVSTATLNGLPDITLFSLSPSTNTPKGGQAITLKADVRNLSNVAVGPFDVTLYSGDPRFPQNPVSTISTQTVQTLGPNSDVNLIFPLTLPNLSGDYVYTVMADPGNAIAEADETNNDAQYNVSFRADPAMAPDSHGSNVMSGQILNFSGVNNVKILVPVANLGTVPISNVPIDLEYSRNGSDFVTVATTTIPSLTAGQSTTLTFITAGLDGDNAYRAIIDPSVDAQDGNLSNNTAQTDLVLHGLADLTVGTLSLSNPTPRQGDPLTLNATISNLGIADAPNALVEVFAQDSTGNQVLVGSTRVDVAALASVNVGIALDTSSLLGQYTLIVQVNRLHEILESNELNNTASIPVNFAASIPINNTINDTAGVANTVTLRVDSNGIDDVWLNVPATGAPTQRADKSQPIIINAGGLTDTLVLDTSNGDPLPVQLDLNGSFTTDLSIGANESIVLGHDPGGSAGSLSVTSLSIDPAGKLDLADGSVTIAYSGPSPLPAIQAYLRGGQIFSSTLVGPQAIADVDSGSAIVLNTRILGDFNGDGVVNFSDLVILAQNYGKTGVDWAHGDVNYDGVVGFPDLVALAQNYGRSAAGPAVAQFAPALAAGPDFNADTKAKATARKHHRYLPRIQSSAKHSARHFESRPI